MAAGGLPAQPFALTSGAFNPALPPPTMFEPRLGASSLPPPPPLPRLPFEVTTLETKSQDLQGESSVGNNHGQASQSLPPMGAAYPHPTNQPLHQFAMLPHPQLVQPSFPPLRPSFHAPAIQEPLLREHVPRGQYQCQRPGCFKPCHPNPEGGYFQFCSKSCGQSFQQTHAPAGAAPTQNQPGQLALAGRTKAAKTLTAVEDITQSAETVIHTINHNLASHPLGQVAESVLHSWNEAFPAVARTLAPGACAIKSTVCSRPGCSKARVSKPGGGLHDFCSRGCAASAGTHLPAVGPQHHPHY